MKHKLNLLLLFPLIIALVSIINQLYLDSSHLYSLIMSFGMIMPVPSAMWLYRKYGGDKQRYCVYTAVVIILDILLIGLIGWLVSAS